MAGEEEKEGFHPGFPRSLRLFDIEWSLSLSGQTHAEPHRASSHPAIPGVTEGLCSDKERDDRPVRVPAAHPPRKALLSSC